MNYGDLTKAEIALKTIWKEDGTNNPTVIDYVLKELGLEETQVEMMNKGILIYRKSHEDYFIPWYNNKFGPNSVKSVKDELLDEALSDYDPEFASFIREKKLLEKQLDELNNPTSSNAPTNSARNSTGGASSSSGIYGKKRVPIADSIWKITTARFRSNELCRGNL